MSINIKLNVYEMDQFIIEELQSAFGNFVEHDDCSSDTITLSYPRIQTSYKFTFLADHRLLAKLIPKYLNDSTEDIVHLFVILAEDLAPKEFGSVLEIIGEEDPTLTMRYHFASSPSQIRVIMENIIQNELLNDLGDAFDEIINNFRVMTTI